MTDREKKPTHGWLILDKPRGTGSTAMVGAVKRLLREAGYLRVKVGHAGTLDPLAEGVLPVALGEATKVAGRMLDADKVYEFTIAFGEETDTLDAEGAIVVRSDKRPPLEAVAAVLPLFTGPIEQVPPAYSAIRSNGRRAYERARAGEEVAMEPRSVTIHEIAVLDAPDEGSTPSELATSFASSDPFNPPAPMVLADTVTLRARVSKGTYIRALARDIARALGTVGHVVYLRRVRAGPFAEEQAISLDKLGEIAQAAAIQDHLLPLEAGLDDIPVLALDLTSAQAVRQGRVVSGMPQPDGFYLAMLNSVPLALLELEGGRTTIVRGFNLPDVAE